MRPIFFSLCFILCAGSVNAAVPPVAEQMRAIEIERQAQERRHWLEDARNIYFDKIQLDMTIGDEFKAEIEKVVDRYKGRFLDAKRADMLCREVKELLLKNISPFSSTSCIIENRTFILQSKP